MRFTPLMYWQNVMLRRNALKFRHHDAQAARDPAMLIYLDELPTAARSKPNENFARGGDGAVHARRRHYTKNQRGRRARVHGLECGSRNGKFMFRRGIHDYGRKPAGAFWHVRWRSGYRHPAFKTETAEFITRKLMREFVTPQPAEQDVQRFAARFRESGYDIAKLMQAMLWRPELFYLMDHRGALIKSPVEFVVGTLKQFEIDAKPQALCAGERICLDKTCFLRRAWAGHGEH